MNKPLNVIVACESSATVRDSFRKLGHNAWSCDLLPCDGDPRFHITDNVLNMLSGKRVHATDANGRQMRGSFAAIKWDLLIGHPPCTYLCNSGVRWLFQGGKGTGIHQCIDWPRWWKMEDAARFFCALWAEKIPHVAIENPIMHKHGKNAIKKFMWIGHNWVKPQIVQPWWFGHPCTKATGLYLRNLPPLVATHTVDPVQGSVMHKLPPGPDRWKLRSKTFQGIADAMASQWSAHIIGERK